eukprot:COSAG06_NODE_8169_length_2251_cov_2.691914_1_plen_51_part_10
MVSGDWWFLAATTPLSLVSPPATSSHQHVAPEIRGVRGVTSRGDRVNTLIN